MFEKWKEYLVNNNSKTKFKQIIDTTEWVENGILPSEAYIIISLINFFNIDLFIESGIRHARSTTLFCKYFEDSQLEIATMDVEIFPEVRQQLSKYKNLKIYHGNAHSIVPAIINQNRNKRIGIFLDGPKSIPAIDLLKTAFTRNNVKFGCIHDMHVLSKGKNNTYIPSGTRPAMESWEKTKFFSDNEELVQELSDLDNNEPENPRDVIYWKPGLYIKNDIVERELGSYGPTIGVAFNG